MIKCKHPLVKMLRKAGVPTKRAMELVSNNRAIWQHLSSKEHRQIDKYYSDVSGWFDWDRTREGGRYWSGVRKRMGSTW